MLCSVLTFEFTNIRLIGVYIIRGSDLGVKKLKIGRVKVFFRPVRMPEQLNLSSHLCFQLDQPVQYAVYLEFLIRTDYHAVASAGYKLFAETVNVMNFRKADLIFLQSLPEWYEKAIAIFILKVQQNDMIAGSAFTLEVFGQAFAMKINRRNEAHQVRNIKLGRF